MSGQEEETLRSMYRELYQGMIGKNASELDRLLDGGFVLAHMTGMEQDKGRFIDAVLSGVPNYYSGDTDSLDVRVDDDSASIIGRSRVEAAVFGGGKHMWRLELRLTARRKDGIWRFTGAEASTYRRRHFCDLQHIRKSIAGTFRGTRFRYDLRRSIISSHT